MSRRAAKVVTTSPYGVTRAEDPRQLSIFVPAECPVHARGTEKEVEHRDRVAQARADFVALLKPHRDGRDRPEPLERRGARVLESAPPERPRQARVMVRLYYTSIGDELLCADFGPYTWQTAESLARRLNDNGARTNPARPNAVTFSLADVGKPSSDPPSGVRKVVFPSEVIYPVVGPAEVCP